MSVEFRQRTPGEYLKIIRKRIWLIILPVIAVTSAVAWVVYRLPNVYESTTLIVVRPSTLPNTVVATMNEDTLTRQLTSIAQVVTSRSSLEPLVEKHSLYLAERLRGEPMESVINMMRRDIKVEVNTSRNEITNGFNISYHGRDPQSTQAVTAELAGKYVGQQTDNAAHATESAKAFFDAQVKQAKDELDAIDKQRVDYMTQNVGNLPSGATTLVNQLGGLRDQQKSLMTEVGRLQDRRSANVNQLTLLKKQAEQNIEDLAENTTDPKTTLGWAQLVQKKADLQAEMQKMLTELKPKHPDVLAKQAQIDSINKEMDLEIGEWKEKIKTKTEKLQGRPDLSVSGLTEETRLVDGEIKREQKLLDDNEKQIGEILQRINSVPGVEIGLGAIEREYQTKKAAYDSLLAQQSRITLSADATQQQQGEKIEVVDPANLPSQPVAPRRYMLSAIGVGVGLGVGLLLVGIFEIPRLMTIQSTEDARHYTGLPVLISVPELLTAQEARAVPRRRRLLLAAGVTVTVVSIPLLALALKATHIFELLSQARPS